MKRKYVRRYNGIYDRLMPRRLNGEPWAKEDGAKERVLKAMSDAWRDGENFSMELDDEGMVRVKKGRHTVQLFEDMGQCLKCLFEVRHD